MREAQVEVLELPNTGRIVITDLGEYKDIHPANKGLVGERFAAIALAFSNVGQGSERSVWF